VGEEDTLISPIHKLFPIYTDFVTI
jgi:hypothetical protein